MTARLTGHLVLEVNGEEQQIDAEAFSEEHEALWKYYGDGFSILVTADLEAAVDDQGHYPTFVDEPEIEGTMAVEILESELAVARGDLFEFEGDEKDEGDEEDDEHDEN